METIKAAANYGLRSYTIRKFTDGGVTTKYRTSRMSQSEFYEHEFNTEQDWGHFLRTDNSYYKVKITRRGKVNK